MAVAVKTPPEKLPGAAPPSPAALSLLGVAYVVACLALLFKVVPALWWAGWERAGLQPYALLGGSLLMTFSVVLAGFFVVVGGRLAGAQAAPAGVRAGTFVGLCSLLLVLLLTRWASLWIEHFAYAGALTPFAGAVATGVVGGALVLLALRVFFSKGAQEGILAFEEAGWFSTNNYKANQGQMVRRGTIFGILVIAGAGIYTLLLHNTLRRFGPDLTLNVPFTGGVATEWNGDGLPLLSDPAIVPLADKATVEVRYPGKTTLRVGQKMSVADYKAGLRTLIGEQDDGPRSVVLSREDREKVLAAADKDPALFLSGVNDVIYQEVNDLLGKKVFSEDTARRIRALDAETDMADLTRLVEFIHREAEAAKAKDPLKKGPELGKELDLPIAVLVVDRFTMKKVDNLLDPKTHVKVGYAGDSGFATGSIVGRATFEEKVAAMKADPLKPTLPSEAAPSPPGGPLRYASLTLLPAIQYTVPLLLIAGAMWLAWRAVNMPAFADFLIATEAEMNKVSWTSQKRLWQDTVVVLATVFLMAVFLFVVDWGWKEILQRLNVLYIPKADPQQKIEQKKY